MMSVELTFVPNKSVDLITQGTVGWVQGGENVGEGGVHSQVRGAREGVEGT